MFESFIFLKDIFLVIYFELIFGELGCLKGCVLNLCFFFLMGIYLLFKNLKYLLFVGMMLNIMLYNLIGFKFFNENFMYGNIFLK